MSPEPERSVAVYVDGRLVFEGRVVELAADTGAGTLELRAELADPPEAPE